MKNALIFMLTGALIGIAIASYVVPPALSWYTEPGGLPQGTQIQALVAIPEVIRYATGRLIRGQFIGASIGAVAGLGLHILLVLRARRAAAEATMAAANPPSPPSPPTTTH